MKICDLTFSYTETSGGIRRYIDQKRQYLLDQTDHEHVLIIPGEEDTIVREGRATTVTIASPIIPGCAPYRYFYRPGKIKKALEETNVDVIELASFYACCPWAAFSYRDARVKNGEPPCLIGGYFHTDIADAYVGTPLRHALVDGLGHWSEIISNLGLKIADAAEAEAEDYFSRIFGKCDQVYAATPAQIERLKEYGIGDAELIPLGVDLECFHPDRADPDFRTELGVAPDEPLLIFAGRIDVEKHVPTLVESLKTLRAGGTPAHLALIGEGPLKKELEDAAASIEGLHLLPFQQDPTALARCLASADFYVTAGPHETFGLSVIEAQAAGLPVVGVEAGALCERVNDRLGRLVPVDDHEAMAAAITQLLPRRQELSHNARQHVEEHFSWDLCFSKLIACYERGLSQPALSIGAA